LVATRGFARCVAVALAWSVVQGAPCNSSARTAAVSGSWEALQSEVLHWPSPELSLRSYLGPFGENFYLAVGFSAARDSRNDVTAAGVLLGLQYMLPLGDRAVPFVEGGFAARALRIDVIDRTGTQAPARDRTTFVRGGFRVGGGIDLALGSNWSVVAAASRTWLDEADVEYVERDGRVVTVSKNTSYWEIPRIALVYWY